MARGLGWPARGAGVAWRLAVALALVAALLLGGALAVPAPAGAATLEFTYTGTLQTWVVPAGVTSATFTVIGAAGGGAGGGLAGGGGSARATLAVTPGATVWIVVGGRGGSVGGCVDQSSPGAGGFNGGASGAGESCGGGGGGGASDVRLGGDTLAHRALVAGGGGGEANGSGPCGPATGGAGGGLVGGDGNSRNCGPNAPGGNQDGTSGSGQPGTGSAASPAESFGGGGGGGGYYGGAGGAALTGGGGGSGFGPPGTVFESGVRLGDGLVTIAHKQAQTIDFPQPSPATHGDPPFGVTATTSSGLVASFTAGPSAVCTASGTNGAIITLVGPGACTITAHQPGDANYLPAPDVERVVGVAPCDGKFVDVAADDPACPAIAALVRNGAIKGYATAPPTFGPDDDVQRAQLAAFLVRALGWQGRPTTPRAFDDFAGLDVELRDASLILANACDGGGNCVARGYDDGRFGPTDPVSRAQVITFIARAFGLDPNFAWQAQPGEALPYSGVPALHATDIRTFTFYAGTIPDAPTTQAGWDAPASRAWVAMVLYQALQSRP